MRCVAPMDVVLCLKLIELRKAHIANDKAVMAAYGFSLKMSEEDCVEELMKLYQKMILEEKMKKSDKKSKKK